MQFFETIKVDGNQLSNLDYHQKRMDRTRMEVKGLKIPIELKKSIIIPNGLPGQLIKCRVTYSEKIEKIEFEPYTPRKIKSLKIVIDNDVEYNYKYSDRDKLNLLFNQKDNCDEILIVKNGLITDTSFSNIVFYDGKKYVTPTNPLLKGTMRQKLMDFHRISEGEIMLTDLRRFKSAFLINAMMDMNDAIEIKIENIV
jgi:4-amino-4-deoxychorismate lyase